jgi:succinoglycan biosynthesis protein ExoW
MQTAGTQTPRIDIVIPFFQREQGILSRSISSIAAQSYPHDALRVIIVDDGSPVSAEEEFGSQPPPQSLRIDILKQQNAGPNEARSLGLDHIDPQAKYVAYLDSDDTWTEGHLRHAVLGLSAGYTAYFANLVHLGADAPTFEKSGYVIPGNHPIVAADPSLHEYRGDMLHQIVTENIIFMPSLVIDKDALGHVRFPKAHRHGGGDYLYWLALIDSGNARFVFSTKPEVICGSGINMWYGSGWGTDGLAKRILDEARYRSVALTRYVKKEETRQMLKARIGELQTLFLQDIAHRVRARKKIDWRTTSRMFREHPPTLAMFKLLAGRAYASLSKRQ